MKSLLNLFNFSLFLNSLQKNQFIDIFILHREDVLRQVVTISRPSWFIYQFRPGSKLDSTLAKLMMLLFSQIHRLSQHLKMILHSFISFTQSMELYSHYSICFAQILRDQYPIF